jgi:hypothetical protein
MHPKIQRLFAIAVLIVLAMGLMGAGSCQSRPTVTVKVCLESGLLAGEKCTQTADRTYYKDPKVGEPVAPTEVCKIHDVAVTPEPEYVTVDVCKVSGLLPGQNCAAVVRKTYIKGQQPTKICDVCQAPIIYPAKSKRPFWVFVPELLTANGNRPAFLKRIRMEGAWGVRVFFMQSWSTINVYPYKQAVFNGQGVKLVVPKEGWSSIVKDLTIPNPEYFTAVGKLLDELHEFDLGLIATIGDDCSIRNDRVQKHNYPMMGSLQTLSKEEDWPYLVPPAAQTECIYSPGGLYSTYRYQWHQAWVNLIIPILTAHAPVPLWIELDNEFSRLGWEATAKEPGNWYAMMKGTIISAGVPQAQIVHSCVKADFDIIKARLGAGIYCQHGIVLPAPQMAQVPAALYPQAMLSGDGGFNGNSPTDLDSFGHKGISPADAVALAKFIKTKGIIGYEWMPRIGWKQNDCLANLDAITDMSVLAAMIAEFNK